MNTHAQLTNSTRRAAARAFTLIELLLVLVILGVLVAVVIPKFTGHTEKARMGKAEADIRILSNALDQYELENGRFPSTDQGLTELVGRINKIPVDPWGKDYVYRYPATRNPDPKGFDLFSEGPDQRESDDDVTNW